MKQFREQGKQFTKGIIDAVLSFLCWWLIAILIATLIAARFDLGVDASDKAGIEYLSDGNGGLIRREYK